MGWRWQSLVAVRILKDQGDGLTGLLRSYPSPPLSQVAVPNLSEAVQDADLLVFVIPHQFIHKICDEITGRVPKKALGITLIKVTALPPEFTPPLLCLRRSVGHLSHRS